MAIKPLLVCPCCSSVFSLPLYRYHDRIKNGAQMFCNRPCSYKYHSTSRIERSISSIRGKTFGRLKVLRGARTFTANDGTSRAAVECSCECGNTVATLVKYLKNGDTRSCGCLHPEVASEQAKLRVGPDSPLWKGGITPENSKVRNSSEYKDWRLSVFKRDNFTCQKCCSNEDLQAHDLYSFSEHKDLRLEIDNGITLCYHCHIKDFHIKYGKLSFTDEDFWDWLL